MRWQSIDCVQCLKSEPAKVHPGRRQRPPRPRWRCTCIPLNVNADQRWQRAAIQSSDIGADATEAKFAGRDTRGSRTRLGRRSDPGVGADSRVDPEFPSRAVWKGPSSSLDGEDWPPSSHRRVRSVPVSSQSGVAARPSWESAASCSSSLFPLSCCCLRVITLARAVCLNEGEDVRTRGGDPQRAPLRMSRHRGDHPLRSERVGVAMTDSSGSFAMAAIGI